MKLNQTSSVYAKRPQAISTVGIVENPAPRDQPISRPLLSRKAASEYLGLGPQTLNQWACSGRYNLTYIKIGRRILYRQTDLDAFIAANVHGGQETGSEISHG